MKILLAIDGSPCSQRAVEEVGKRPWPKGSEVKLLNTFELPLPVTPEGWALPPTFFDEMDVAVRKQSQIIVERALDILRSKMNKDLTVTGSYFPGSPTATILEEAKKWGADLIVVGSHGYSGWQRFLLGSVSQSVVSHAPCSVEVVRCPVSEAMIEEERSKKEL
jgi:nucleotide-binding universal stress UspA family protein